ncbi:MAG: 30S ribosomal protein S9 [Candidatus Dadabacteria bacterium]|nr:MAG: 30S ribosomal protein S9 [Candidatus Dadabacteria bacterium]
MFKGEGVQSTGRRKRAVARVIMREGEPKVVVNNSTVEEYFQRNSLISRALEPLQTASEIAEKMLVLVKVQGGGKSGQADAVRHGIARAIVALNPDLKPLMRKHGFLTRDPREVERKKYGKHKARKSTQYSKR